MNGQRPHEGGPKEKQAWALLATLEDHPQIQEWLKRSDTEHRTVRIHPPLLFRRRAWQAAAAVGSVLLIGGLIAWQFGARQYETAVGEQRDVVLRDGSRVTLNTNTSLTVHYSAKFRRVQLQRGEALFEVKHDPTHPFEVLAGGTITRAVGTEFNVDLRQDRVTVSVLEGMVKVSAPDAKDASGAQGLAALVTGQATAYAPIEHRLRTQRADVRRIEAWRTRRLEFTDTPLSDALSEFNRYSRKRIVIGTPDIATTRVSGIFNIGDPDSLLFSLQEVLHAQVHESDDEIILTAGGS